MGVSDSGGSNSGNIRANSDPLIAPPKPTDPELAAVISAWPNLPEPVRAGITAMVYAASGGKKK